MKRLTTLFAGLALAGLVHAETALTKRAVPLQAAASADSAVLATLEQDTRVEVLARKGAWNQVKAPAQTGWVRMMSLKVEGAGGEAKAGSVSGANPLGGLANLLGSGRSDNNATVTTGVRGLSAEDLANAQANEQELEKLKKFSVGKQAGQAFAKRSKLAASSHDYLEAPKPAATQEAAPGIYTGN